LTGSSGVPLSSNTMCRDDQNKKAKRRRDMASIEKKRMDNTRNRSRNLYLSRGPGFSSSFWPEDDDSLANLAEFISIDRSWPSMVVRAGPFDEATGVAISVSGH